ncbi:MAG: hypothetical protein WCQ50_22310 [Spirochaetota bacterium]
MVGIDVVVIIRIEDATTKFRVLDAVSPMLSVAVTVTFVAEPERGVPVIVPFEFRIKPLGKPEPVQTNGVLHPEPSRVAEYDVPTLPWGKDVVTILTLGTDERIACFVTVAPATSEIVTLTAWLVKRSTLVPLM